MLIKENFCNGNCFCNCRDRGFYKEQDFSGPDGEKTENILINILKEVENDNKPDFV